MSVSTEEVTCYVTHQQTALYVVMAAGKPSLIPNRFLHPLATPWKGENCHRHSITSSRYYQLLQWMRSQCGFRFQSVVFFFTKHTSHEHDIIADKDHIKINFSNVCTSMCYKNQNKAKFKELSLVTLIDIGHLDDTHILAACLKLSSVGVLGGRG